MIGAIYLTLSEKYRNDSFRDTIGSCLDRAIELCENKIEAHNENAEIYFIQGASYGYRGIHKAYHGSWWGAFRDGLHCHNSLKKALEYDSTYYDAYWALGSYHYYKTIKSKIFLWLPFVSDRREEGMNEIRIAIKKGLLAPQLARMAFLRIYLFEEQYTAMAALADSLDILVPDDAYILLYYTEALVELDSLNKAEQKLEQLRLIWKKSPYFDRLGAFEADLLLAKIIYRDGDSETAARIAENILKYEKERDQNAYFEETYDKTKKFLRDLK